MSVTPSKPFNNLAKVRLVNPYAGKLYPLSFRVTAKEKALIQTFAGDQSVSAYVRDAALKGKVSKRKIDPNIKIDMAARILGALGQTELFASLSTLADAARSGSLPVSDELVAELQNACALSVAIRNDLIEALGIKVRD